MKNKEIAQKVGTTEQVVKNYLRKVYDKLGVADRLELALFCLHNRVLDNAKAAAPVATPVAPATTAAAAAAAGNAGATTTTSPAALPEAASTQNTPEQ